MVPTKYADQVVDWLQDEGYGTCFFLAGGNIMHLLDAVRTRMHCIPVVHEVAAGIAAEYFNATRPEHSPKAFALVTAGPGVTNILTAMAGAYAESRELLVIAGQVKSIDLADETLRQRGIQEVNACALAAPVSKISVQLKQPVPKETFLHIVRTSHEARPGPVFIDFCLDAQAAPPVESDGSQGLPPEASSLGVEEDGFREAVAHLERSKRPVLLLGGGVSRSLARDVVPALRAESVPIATTWNALDRIDYDDPVFVGRPDTWGMRWANALIQQADLVIAVGARLSLQQTGFNWERFAPLATVVHVDVDRAELEKSHPRKDLCIHASADGFLRHLATTVRQRDEWVEWLTFAREIQMLLPLDDPENMTAKGFISPYQFASDLSDYMRSSDILIPCSSGGASTVLMQAFRQKLGQLVVNNKALASMGYGLSGAVGASSANPSRRVFLVEGDGGFAQNLQELGTVAIRRLNIKAFIFENRGYASIRMTQRNYFGGSYVGCDEATGVGLPDFLALGAAYGIPSVRLDTDQGFRDEELRTLLDSPGPAIIVVPLDPEQTYFPKISSRINAAGSMASDPLHQMTPYMPLTLTAVVLPYLESEAQ